MKGKASDEHIFILISQTCFELTQPLDLRILAQKQKVWLGYPKRVNLKCIIKRFCAKDNGKNVFVTFKNVKIWLFNLNDITIKSIFKGCV